MHVLKKKKKNKFFHVEIFSGENYFGEITRLYIIKTE